MHRNHNLLFFLSLAVMLPGCALRRQVKNIENLSFSPLRETAQPAYIKEVLPNGLTLFLMEDHSLPLINFHALIKTGDIYDPEGKRGLGEMAFEVIRTGGAGSMAGDKIDETLEHIGCRINAGIDWDMGTVGGISDRQNFNTVFGIFANILQFPRFEEEKIELSRISKNSQISRRNDDIDGIAEREFRKLVYGKDSPYARTIEYETINSVTRDDMIKFHGLFFRPEKIILGICGDFHSGEMLEYVKEVLGKWETADVPAYPAVPAADFIAPAPSVNLFIKKEATQSVVIMGHAGLRRDHPDYFASLVLSRILGMGWHSRFSRNLRQREGLAYNIWAGIFGEFNYPGLFYAQAQTQSERTIEAIGRMQKEIELISEGVTGEELYAAKEGIINSEVFWSDTRDKIMQRLLRYEYYGYPSDYPQQLLEGVGATAKEDVSEVAKRHLFPEKLTVLIVGSPEKFGAPLPEGTNILDNP